MTLGRILLATYLIRLCPIRLWQQCMCKRTLPQVNGCQGEVLADVASPEMRVACGKLCRRPPWETIASAHAGLSRSPLESDHPLYHLVNTVHQWSASRHYLNPSFLYPALLAYQLATGFSILSSHGRLIT